MQNKEGNYTSIVIYPDLGYEKGVNRLYEIYPKDVESKEDIVDLLADIRAKLQTGYPYRLEIKGISNSIVKRILEIIKTLNLTVDIYSNQLKTIDYAIGLKGMTITVNTVEEYKKICNMPKKFILATYPKVLDKVYKDVKQRKNIEGIKLISKNLISVTPDMIEQFKPNLIGLLNSSGFVSFRDLYFPKDFIKVQKQALSIIENLSDYKRRITETEAFLFVYNELGEQIEYDKNVLREKNSGMYAHNLLALLAKTSACEGIAKSLTEILRLIGIKSVVIVGDMKEKQSNMAHAWNKVKIGDKWYNCDLTHDGWLIREGGKPTRCLVSNEEFDKQGYIMDNYDEFETSKENFNQEIIRRFFEEDHSKVSKKIETKVSSPKELVRQIVDVKEFYKKPIYISLSRVDDSHYAMSLRRKLKGGMLKNISTETPMFEVDKRGEFLLEFQRNLGIKKAKKGCIIGDGIIVKASKDKIKEKTKSEEIR